MALDPCVRVILCGLGSAAIAALRPVIETAQTAANVQLGVLRAQLTALDVYLVPVQEVLSAAQQAVSLVRQTTDLIPTSLGAGLGPCLDLGQLKIGVVGAVVRDAEARFADLSAQALRILSIKDELEAAIQALESLFGLCTEVLAVIEDCAVGAN